MKSAVPAAGIRLVTRVWPLFLPVVDAGDSAGPCRPGCSRRCRPGPAPAAATGRCPCPPASRSRPFVAPTPPGRPRLPATTCAAGSWSEGDPQGRQDIATEGDPDLGPGDRARVLVPEGRRAQLQQGVGGVRRIGDDGRRDGGDDGPDVGPVLPVVRPLRDEGRQRHLVGVGNGDLIRRAGHVEPVDRRPRGHRGGRDPRRRDGRRRLRDGAPGSSDVELPCPERPTPARRGVEGGGRCPTGLVLHVDDHVVREVQLDHALVGRVGDRRDDEVAPPGVAGVGAYGAGAVSTRCVHADRVGGRRVRLTRRRQGQPVRREGRRTLPSPARTSIPRSSRSWCAS